MMDNFEELIVSAASTILDKVNTVVYYYDDCDLEVIESCKVIENTVIQLLDDLFPGDSPTELINKYREKENV